MITEKNLQLYRTAHEGEDTFAGNSLLGYVPHIARLCDLLKPKSIIDWGCGKASVWKFLRKDLPTLTDLRLYDPAVPQYSRYPDKKYDLLVCTDVLEHIPEDDIPATLLEMLGHCRGAFFGVPTYRAINLLPDGSNPHVTVREPVWWQVKFSEASNARMVPVIAVIKLKRLLQNPDLTGYLDNGGEVHFSWVPKNA